MKNKKLLKKFMPIALLIVIISIVAIFINKIQKNEFAMTPKQSRIQAYEDVLPEDKAVYDENNDEITAIQFDAFFLEDKNGDGYAESVRGTCNEIGTEAKFYMELNVIEEGQLKNAMITINSNNFYLNTTIVKDNMIAENYISSNTKTIKFNDMGNGSQALLMGSVRSGDYSATARRAEAIGNDTSKYSKENTVTFSGTYVDSNGKERSFSKTVPFIIDWYGEVNAEITPTAQIVETTDFGNLITEEGLSLDFDIKVEETQNQLIISGSYISGTIPELNGYKPLSVKISGTNVTYEYNEETGEFTAQREAIINSDGVVISNGFTSSNTNTKINTYNFTVVYPIEAYQEMGEDITSIELAIPVQAVNKGYNNPHTEDGFENPYTSNTATGIVVTTWQPPIEQMSAPSFYINVGSYLGKPYNTNGISKGKPLNIYNGISLEETDDTYIVEWRAYTGTDGITDGIIMNETTGKVDNFLDVSANDISMEPLTTNKGIYFSGATNTLGTDGWIKVYDAETNALIETFTSSNWNNYSSSNPYIYENKIKHIRIETSATNELSYLYVYNVKELDDEYITENFTREKFDDLEFIESYLDGYMIQHSEDLGTTEDVTYWYSKSVNAKALYVAPTSVANISIKEDTISTKATAENEKITITTETSGYNEQKWKNGIYLIKLPSDIIYVEINSVTTNNENVKISAYDLYEENGSYFIKILTENEKEESYDIVVDCNLTPDPRINEKTADIELYATNEIANDYYYNKTDEYDIDGDTNTTEKVNYRKISLTMDPGTSLNTTQIGSDYGDNGNITIAPRVAKTDKDQRTATVSISATNNYDFDIQDVKIQGVIPFEGNDYVLSGRDLGSTFTTYITQEGISIATEGLENYVTIYYSAVENPTNDISEKANGWTLAENVQDWSTIKTYIIILDNEYKLSSGQTIEFKYEISIPEGIDYNEVTYSEHAIYFTLVTSDGKYATSTGSEKLGFMIAKQYNLEIVKYQEDTEKTLQGITFTLKEEGQNTSSIKTTGANGIIKFTGLFVERYYTLKEERTIEDYVLNNQEIKFYTTTQINADGTESLILEYVNSDGTHMNSSEIYPSIISDDIFAPNEDTEEDYKIQFKIANEVKVRLAINKTDKTTGQTLKNIRFILTGEGKDGVILNTDTSGNINVSGLYLDHEYTLAETKATGYYVPQQPIKFMITNENGEFKFVSYTDNGTTLSNTITVNDEIPTINIDLVNEKIPTYGLQLTKYAKGEKEANATGEMVDKVLEKAQYKIYGEGINEDGKIYTTDENGILTIDGLYEYAEGKYITGEYTITEIYAPEGYAINNTPLKFKAYRENGTLKIEIIEGQDVIRVIETTDTEGNVTSSTTDLNIIDASSTYPVIQIGVEDSQIFTLFKYMVDGTTSEKIPIPGTKFVITDLEGNYVTGSDGKTIGEWDEALQKYVVTTDENGQISANVKEGLYKAVEVYVEDRYVFNENEEDRTYYFGVGTSQAAMWGWINYNTINGKGWDYINDLEKTSSGGFIGIGDFSDYSINGEENGIDINKDGVIDNISRGNLDSIIINYDENGNHIWSKTFGGNDEESLSKIIQTYDDGYAVIGYVTSNTVYYDGTEIAELSKTEDNTNLAYKDAVLLKLDKNGNYEWGIRFGGTGNDEIKAVAETNQKQLVVVGNFYSDTMNFYEYNAGTISDIKGTFNNTNTTNADMYRSGMSGFIATYSETGKYEWSQRISGDYDVEVVDVTNTSEGLAVAVNHINTVYLNTARTVSQTGASTYATDGTVVGYNLDGSYSWRYRLYTTTSSAYGSPKNIEISSLETTEDNNIIVAVEYSGILNGSQNGNTATTIVDTAPTNSIYDATLIEISKDGTYIDNIYTLSGNYDDYISDVVATSDGGYLLGGWYYSDEGIDVDGDGTITGIYDLKELTGEYTSDGFMIKIDSDSKINAVSRMYGDGYDAVVSVLETENGNIVSGGYFSSSTLTVSSYKAMVEQQTTEEVIMEIQQKGNFDGFVAIEGIASAEVPIAQNLQVENKVKTFKITTEVIKHDESGTQVAGGDIDGEEGIFGGIEYSKDGIRYVETVEYENNATKEIIITPDSGYTISYIKINNEEYTNFIINNEGTVTLPIFEKVTEDIHITVEFSNTISSIEVNHLLWTEADGLTTQKVAESENYAGTIGETYTTLPKTDIEYEIITNADYYGSSLPTDVNGEDLYIPDNYTGSYTEGQKIIVNYYYKEKTYNLIVHHYLVGTNQQVPLKGSVSGETVEDEQTSGLKKGQVYTTVQAPNDKIDYSIYELVEVPTNAKGTIEEDTEVIYYYQIITANISFTKVAEENHTENIANTEFALYALNDKNAIEKDELIDTTNVAECWTLVNTYITSETGRMRLEDLPITTEYRLVETKAAEDRLIANGQWKIEFMYGEYDTTDTTIITYNGTDLKITAIGNPPAIAITEEGELQIPNREYFDFPTSGSIGSLTFYEIGGIVISIGFILLIGRKYIFLLNKKNKKN